MARSSTFTLYVKIINQVYYLGAYHSIYQRILDFLSKKDKKQS